MTKAFLFFAGLVLANIVPALIHLPPPENADVIAVVRVMSLSPTSDQRVLVKAFVNQVAKGAKPGQAMDFAVAGMGNYYRGGEYLIHATKTSDGWDVTSSIETRGNPETAANLIRLVRNQMNQVEAAKSEAVKLYPSLGDPKSRFNAEFARRYVEHKRRHSDLFTDRNWPVTLAREVADSMK